MDCVLRKSLNYPEFRSCSVFSAAFMQIGLLRQFGSIEAKIVFDMHRWASPTGSDRIFLEISGAAKSIKVQFL